MANFPPDESNPAIRTLHGIEAVVEPEDGRSLVTLTGDDAGPSVVLLVDDQALIAAGCRRLLAEDPGLELIHCQDPRQAVEAARRADPSVLLVDLVMPDVDGLTLVRAFRADPVTAQVPIVVLSSKDESILKAHAFKLGANDYMVKFPDRTEFLARIRYHVAAHEAAREREKARRRLARSLRELDRERKKSEALLLNVLPRSVAERLREGEQLIADLYPSVSVLFADLVGFTPLSSTLSPGALVEMLNGIFSAFDALAGARDLEKIKTIGDSYMVASGVPVPRDDHAIQLAGLGLEMHDALQGIATERGLDLELRIGIHSGPVVAGVIGTRKFAFDLWGTTVNVASRMESHGVKGRVQVSRKTAGMLRGHYPLETRGQIEVKGCGQMEVFLVGAG